MLRSPEQRHNFNCVEGVEGPIQTSTTLQSNDGRADKATSAFGKDHPAWDSRAIGKILVYCPIRFGSVNDIAGTNVISMSATNIAV